MRSSWRVAAAASLASSLLFLCSDANADTLNLQVTDSSGNPLKNAVVGAFSQNNPHHPPVHLKKTVIIDQIDKAFIDHVTPIQVGTAIYFPNHDQVRHHVYSLSPTKSFEIPLYKGRSAEPVIFEQEGEVVLGCNIHDWMSAYIVVIASPYFATTDEQGHSLLTLPAGDYELRYWHPDADEQAKNSKQTINIAAGQTVNTIVEIATIPFAFKNTHFQHTSFREGLRCRSLKEMTIPALLRLALRENLPAQNGHS